MVPNAAPCAMVKVTSEGIFILAQLFSAGRGGAAPRLTSCAYPITLVPNPCPSDAFFLA